MKIGSRAVSVASTMVALIPCAFRREAIVSNSDTLLFLCLIKEKGWHLPPLRLRECQPPNFLRLDAGKLRPPSIENT